MSWLELPRTPELEVMSDVEEAEAYTSAAAQSYLSSVDDTLVDQILSAGISEAAWLLDIGTGPGNIPIKLARRCPHLKIMGVDRSANMLRLARSAAAKAGLSPRVEFIAGDAYSLSFPNAFFDVVLSNSVLHHLREPLVAFQEMFRVAKPEALILSRDLRRPSRPAFPFHVCWFGRHYSGLMKTLYVNSVRASYTRRELADLLSRSAISDARIFHHRWTHLCFIQDTRIPRKA